MAASLATFLPVSALLVATLVGAVWLRRRMETQGLGPSGRSVRLTAEHAVHVVEVDGRRWMLGTGPAGAPSLLAELPAAGQGGDG